MKHSVVIPAHNEEGCIRGAVQGLISSLDTGKYDYEIIVVADHVTDGTEDVLAELCGQNQRLKWIKNAGKPGYGMAVRTGLDAFMGDAVTVYMADASDDPADVCRYFDAVEAGAECVFGSRFIREGKVNDYPAHKLVLNRLANNFIRCLFRHGLNDTTNAFKCYRRNVIDGCRPFLSQHFNLTVELPLKAVIRGYRYEVIPISWTNRTTGVSKLKIKEMGSRYLFIVLYCWLEMVLAEADYRRQHDG